MNTAMPANTDMPANAAMLALRQKCTFGNIAEELLCVSRATLHRNKYASILTVMLYGVHVVRIVRIIYIFYILDNSLVLITAQAKNIDIARAITLVRAI